MSNQVSTENQYFQVKLTEIREEESKNGGIKLKKIRYTYIVYTDTISSAEKLASTYADSLFDSYEINNISDSRIIGVINQHGDIDKH